MTSIQRFPRVAIYCAGPEFGGAERSVGYLSTGLTDDIEVTILSPSGSLLERIAQIDPSVATAAIERSATLAGRVRAIRRGLLAVEPDVVQVILPSPWAARDALIAAHSLNLPVVAAEHLVLRPRRRRGRWLQRVLSWPVVTTVAVGRQSAQQLVDWWGLPRSSIRVIYNGIPDVTSAPHPFERRPVIGCACRLEHQKGLDVLIRAIVDLPLVTVVLVGDGQERSSLAALAADLGVADRVSFVGWVDDARSYIAGLDVFVLPSRHEAFPLSILEAMLSSTAVIATDVGSVAEVVLDGQTGILVPPEDVGALQEAIQRMLSDHDLRSNVVRRANALVRERFTAGSMAAQYAALWREVADRYPRGRWRLTTQPRQG